MGNLTHWHCLPQAWARERDRVSKVVERISLQRTPEFDKLDLLEVVKEDQICSVNGERRDLCVHAVRSPVLCDGPRLLRLLIHARPGGDTAPRMP